jgi:hypothetical protein
MQFINPTESQELLLLGGNASLGFQIYERNGSEQPPTFQLYHSLKFEEDSDYGNCFVVKGKYLFVLL